MSTDSTAAVAASVPALEPTRLFPSPLTTSFAAHLDRYGPLPRAGRALVDEVGRAGLRGRGGAGFPTGTKMAAVARGRGRTVVVANGAEGEPASAKDKALMRFAPHLVLDGATLAAEAVGADEITLCVDRAHPEVHAALEVALAERRQAGVERVVVRLAASPSRYVAGEESALVHWLNGGEAKPTFVPPRPFERGVRGRPTLVENVETLAHVGLIGRFGADWFRALGTPEDPGTQLVTITGGVPRPGVYEVTGGSSLESVLVLAGASVGDIEALLVGGYFGTWVPAASIPQVGLGAQSLRRVGAGIGCGVLFALPTGVCGIAEAARITRWLADENAGQCGPCVNGLGALADGMVALAEGRWDPPSAFRELDRLTALVAGRGACRHPDGVARFVRSSLHVFGEHATFHAASGPCGRDRRLLPTPMPGAWR